MKSVTISICHYNNKYKQCCTLLIAVIRVCDNIEKINQWINFPFCINTIGLHYFLCVVLLFILSTLFPSYLSFFFCFFLCVSHLTVVFVWFSFVLVFVCDFKIVYCTVAKLTLNSIRSVHFCDIWLCVHNVHIHRWFTFERWWLFLCKLIRLVFQLFTDNLFFFSHHFFVAVISVCKSFHSVSVYLRSSAWLIRLWFNFFSSIVGCRCRLMYEMLYIQHRKPIEMVPTPLRVFNGRIKCNVFSFSLYFNLDAGCSVVFPHSILWLWRFRKKSSKREWKKKERKKHTHKLIKLSKFDKLKKKDF